MQCPACQNDAEELYIAPGGGQVCEVCLEVFKQLNLARIRGGVG